eukprot:2503479-Pyramimonas_sp.AAC.1
MASVSCGRLPSSTAAGPQRIRKSGPMSGKEASRRLIMDPRLGGASMHAPHHRSPAPSGRACSTRQWREGRGHIPADRTNVVRGGGIYARGERSPAPSGTACSARA